MGFQKIVILPTGQDFTSAGNVHLEAKHIAAWFEGGEIHVDGSE